MNTELLPISSLELNTGQVDGLPTNPRQWTQQEVDKLAKSLKETPELFHMRPVIVYPFGKKYIVLGGNMRMTAAKQNGDKLVPCVVVPEQTPVSKLREIVVKDNGAFGSWDYDELANKWDDLPLVDWGVPAWDVKEMQIQTAADDAEEIERKRKEFEDRMKAGEISEEDEEYQEFLAKFELKKTTDDCYTPELVYNAVADWVAKTYGVNPAAFVRPFYPGGDYQNERYVAGSVVVDNPPFSILAEILKFYTERKVKFFLFAPHLTLFSSSSSAATALPVGVGVTYANGANVNTSFLTNLEPREIRLRSCPDLYWTIKNANDENLKQQKKQLPKYEYDHHVITAAFVSQLSRLGIEFSVPMAESMKIGELDMQKAAKKSIFGSGYLVSDYVFQEREKAEREKAERWELSEREREIIKQLNAKH